MTTTRGNRKAKTERHQRRERGKGLHRTVLVVLLYLVENLESYFFSNENINDYKTY